MAILHSNTGSGDQPDTRAQCCRNEREIQQCLLFDRFSTPGDERVTAVPSFATAGGSFSCPIRAVSKRARCRRPRHGPTGATCWPVVVDSVGSPRCRGSRDAADCLQLRVRPSHVAARKVTGRRPTDGRSSLVHLLPRPVRTELRRIQLHRQARRRELLGGPLERTSHRRRA